ncbi:hypothetical protein [Shouchella shacheensis]|uniref:hypothetical protein n=1 Tax=Shouchella shacheensis TaxID=1649580 RepID=UPI000ABF5A34|nr:hypothetical protein [Shouchella shacheensis]
MHYEFSAEVNRLLENDSNETVSMRYLSHSWQMPAIGPRPPYYAHPRYEPYYPVV